MKSIACLIFLLVFCLGGSVENAVLAEVIAENNIAEPDPTIATVAPIAELSATVTAISHNASNDYQVLPGIGHSVRARLVQYRAQKHSLIEDELKHQKLLSQATPVNTDKMPATTQPDAKTKNKNRVAQFLSSPGMELYTAAGVGVPFLTEGRAGRRQAMRTVDALLVGGIVETALKRITRQKRPMGGGYGFPSGHATASFVVATMQSHYHPKQAVYWYTGAALISASRVKLRRHYVRDVLVGALIGYGIGRWEVSSRRGLILSPFISSNEMPRSGRVKQDKFSWHFSKRF